MRKVKTDFFCVKTKKNYEVGDEYRGKRTDLDHVLEPESKPEPPKKEDKQHPKTKKKAIETKKKK